MKAYSMGITKEQFVNEIKAHQLADNFIKGNYTKGKKGCAVGCSIKSINKLKGKRLAPSDHPQYENHLGIPEWLAIIEDNFFEEVSLERSKTWPLEFSEAINQDADLSKVKLPFIVYILQQNLLTLYGLETDNSDVKEAIDQSRAAVEQMIAAQKSQDENLILAAESAAISAACSAARSAESAAAAAISAAGSSRSAAVAAAARSAARSAAGSSAWSSESAAESAAWSAASAARSAAESALGTTESAAWSAAESALGSSAASAAIWSSDSAAESEAAARTSIWSAAAVAAAARSATWSAAAAALSGSAARSAAFEKYADKLLQLLRECK